MQRVIGSFVSLALLLTLSVAGQSMVIEAEDGVEAFTACSFHHVITSCDYVHIDGEVAPSVGGTVRLDGRPYFVEWLGPGYYLDSGLILQPRGATRRGLKGQSWLEVYPDPGKLHTSRTWKDVDGNRALSASDMLALDAGPEVMVRDVRLQMRVVPAPPEP